jgi:hypothetical protein
VLTPITETRYSATLNSTIVLSKKKARRKKGNPLWIKQTNRKDTLDQKQVHPADRTCFEINPTTADEIVAIHGLLANSELKFTPRFQF